MSPQVLRQLLRSRKTEPRCCKFVLFSSICTKTLTLIGQVRVESAKFDQQKDEFMNVEGEAAVDVDMMKELR